MMELRKDVMELRNEDVKELRNEGRDGAEK